MRFAPCTSAARRLAASLPARRAGSVTHDGPWPRRCRPVLGGAEASLCGVTPRRPQSDMRRRPDTFVMAAAHATRAAPLQEFLATGGRLTQAAHLAWEQMIRPGDTVVDTTCGNGHDTVFLARLVGQSGCVYGFDVQDAAIASTTKRVNEMVPAESRPRLHLIKGCHSTMSTHVPEAKLVCFNLGYLPSADKSVTTQTASTLEAIKSARQLVVPGGAISILCYTGHPGGMDEYTAVVELIEGFPTQDWIVTEHRMVNRPSAPILQLLWKKNKWEGHFMDP